MLSLLSISEMVPSPENIKMSVTTAVARMVGVTIFIHLFIRLTLLVYGILRSYKLYQTGKRLRQVSVFVLVVVRK